MIARFIAALALYIVAASLMITIYYQMLQMLGYSSLEAAGLVVAIVASKGLADQITKSLGVRS